MQRKGAGHYLSGEGLDNYGGGVKNLNTFLGLNLFYQIFFLRGDQNFVFKIIFVHFSEVKIMAQIENSKLLKK